MALEEDIAELDSVLDGLNDMMNDLNVRGVLEFFPTNNNNNVSVIELCLISVYTIQHCLQNTLSNSKQPLTSRKKIRFKSGRFSQC